MECKNCIFVYRPDDNTDACVVCSFKPNKVLDGGKCDKKLTGDDL